MSKAKSHILRPRKEPLKGFGRRRDVAILMLLGSTKSSTKRFSGKRRHLHQLEQEIHDQQARMENIDGSYR